MVNVQNKFNLERSVLQLPAFYTTDILLLIIITIINIIIITAIVSTR
jgi:hypothetical protein